MHTHARTARHACAARACSSLRGEDGSILGADQASQQFGIKSTAMGNNFSRPEGQNVGNFLGDRPSSRVLAAPGGKSSMSLGHAESTPSVPPHLRSSMPLAEGELAPEKAPTPPAAKAPSPAKPPSKFSAAMAAKISGQAPPVPAAKAPAAPVPEGPPISAGDPEFSTPPGAPDPKLDEPAPAAAPVRDRAAGFN